LPSAHDDPARRKRPSLIWVRALPAAGALVLALHQLAAPFLPGCRCRHHESGVCPHAQPAEPEAPVVPEGASCHVGGHAGSLGTEAEAEAVTNHVDEPELESGAHCPVDRVLARCVGGPARGLSAVHAAVERGALPATLAEAPRVGVPVLAVSTRAQPPPGSARLLDPPPTPPPRSPSALV
jgi:hypothetical protein